MILTNLRRAVALVVVGLVLTFAYAFLGTGLSQLLFQHQADGSLGANGSNLIGQNWSQAPCPGHPLGSCVFQGRPDALGPYAGSLKPAASPAS
jgi:K+-transporting ATPase c subunit